MRGGQHGTDTSIAARAYRGGARGAHPTAGVSALSGAAMGRDAHPSLFRPLELLELSPEDENLAYQDIAMRVFDVLGSDETRGTAATELLAVPVWTAWEQTKKRRNTNDR